MLELAGVTAAYGAGQVLFGVDLQLGAGEDFFASNLQILSTLLPASINGIGPRAGEKLAALGIHQIGELAQAELIFLQQHFGRSYGHWLFEAAHGRDDREIITHREPKSTSRETTFERDLHPRHDKAQLGEIFTALCTRVAEDLNKKGYVGRTIGIKLRYADFSTITRDVTLPEPTANAQTIRRAASECLRRVPLEQRLRLIGVRIGGLSMPQEDIASQGQLPLV